MSAIERPTRWGNSLIHLAPQSDYWQWKQGGYHAKCGVWIPDPMDSGKVLQDMGVIPSGTFARKCKKCFLKEDNRDA